MARAASQKRERSTGGGGETKLAVTKLAASGLTMTQATELGMEVLTAAATTNLHKSFDAKASLKINYFSIDDKPLKPRPGWPAFYRLRYLEASEEGRVSFAQQTDEKPRRYVNEPEAGVAAYFPRVVDWRELAENPDEPLIFTEGELKAAKATIEGFPTIGLGGVFNFRAVRQGIPFLPELDQINWVKRYAYICFDSDFRTNANVCLALNMLAEELEARGAIPMVLSLPDVVEDSKTGLDDLLVSAPQATQLLKQLLREAEPLGLARPLWQFNDKVVYVQDPGLVIRRSSHQKMSPAAFKEHAFSTVSYVEQTMGSDGEMRYKKVPAAPAWIKWPLRAEATKVVYKPGQPEMVPDKHGEAYNIWKGWACRPEKGDVALWVALLDHLFQGVDKEDRIWFERWLAYPLQFPGTKLFSASVMHGIHHGTGKSLVGFMMGRIYGDNFVEISRKMLESGNNDWAEAKQFVLADEVTGSSKREFNDMLKKMITQERMRINIKYVPTFDIEDVINYYFTSNHPDAFFMEDNERRYFIHEVKAKPLDLQFYQRFDEWMKRGGGPAAVFHHLLNLKLGDFNPYAPARKTRALERMIMDTKSDLGSWVLRLKEDPEGMLRVGQVPVTKDLFTNRDLLEIYDPDGRTGTTANGLGRELRRAGFPQAYDGHPLPGPNGADRYYILRNREVWLHADRKKLVKHINAFQRKRAKKMGAQKF